jgi:hypothetical protein
MLPITTYPTTLTVSAPRCLAVFDQTPRMLNRALLIASGYSDFLIDRLAGGGSVLSAPDDRGLTVELADGTRYAVSLSFLAGDTTEITITGQRDPAPR